MRAWMFAVLLPTLGCLRNTSFKCDTSDQCGTDGVCEAQHYCSFPDPQCGRRFGPQAGDLAGQCVTGGTGTDAGVDSPILPGDGSSDGGGPMCPSDYMQLAGAPTNRRYKLIANATDWVSQRAACNGTHTFLAAPDSATELAALDKLAGITVLAYWIGVDDLAAAGTWVTVNNTPQTYLPWAPTFPTGNPNDQCVDVITANAQFENTKCTTPLPAICECE